MLKILFLASLLVVELLSSTIKVAVAANVSYAMDELKCEFIKLHPETKVSVVIGSSGKLTAQILRGAPFGVFLSANMLYPNKLYAKKVATTQPVVYAKGSLALFSTKNFDLSKGLAILQDKQIKRVAIANPKTAPYGKASFEALRNAGLLEQVKSKFIYGESISQTISYAVSAADVALIAKSSLFSSKMARYKKGVNWREVDTKLYTPIKQGIVLLKYAKNRQEYKDFYDFILSQKGKKILQKYGYITL